MDPDREDLVVLHLASVTVPASGPAPRAASVPGICEALELEGSSVADRVALLSAIDACRQAGFVREDRRPVEGLDGDHAVYDLTPDGEDRAARLRADLADRTVTVRTADGDAEVSLRAVDRYLAAPAMVRALARTTEDGVVYADRDVERGIVDREAALRRLTGVLEDVAGAGSDDADDPATTDDAADPGSESGDSGTESGDGRDTGDESGRRHEDGSERGRPEGRTGRRGRTALVSGAAGLGKTTLATDALADRARERGLGVAVGRCREAGAGPYAPFRAAIGDRLDGQLDGAPVTPEDDADYGAARTAAFDAVADRLAAGPPLLLVVDDLHVADDATVALFEHLVDRAPPGLLLVGTFRPDELDDARIGRLAGHDESTAGDDADDAPEGGDARADGEDDDARDPVRVDLAPFDVADVRRLVGRLVGRRDLPSSFVRAVADHSGGVPLFVEAVVDRLLSTGDLDPERGVYPESIADAGVPDRVEDAVEQRLSPLDAETTTLRTAALVGGDVPFGVLKRAVDADPATLRDRIDLLVAAGVLERAGDGRTDDWGDDDDRIDGATRTDDRGNGGSDDGGSDAGDPEGPTLRFASGLVRETAVDAVPDERRRELHERIAAAYAARESDPDRHAAVAHHYERADRPEAAFEAYRRAVDRALDVYAHERALEAAHAALELARERLDRPEDDPAVVDLLTSVADVHYLLGEYDEADRYYRYVDERTDDPRRGRRIAGVRADLRASRGQYEDGLAVVEDAVDRYGLDDDPESARLLGRRGVQHANLDDLSAAADAYERAREIAERTGDPAARASAELNWGSLVLRRHDDPGEAVDHLRRAADLADRAGDDRTRARALSNLAMAHRRTGDFDRAERVARERVAVQERIGDRVTLCRARVYLAWVLQSAGEFEEARRLHERALSTARELDNDELASLIHVDLGLLAAEQSDLPEASEQFRQAAEAARSVDDDARRLVALLDLADTELDRGNVATAREHAAAGHELAPAVGRPARTAFAAVVLGEVLRADGDHDRAVERFEAAREAAREADRPGLLAEALAGLSAVALDRSDSGPDASLDPAREYARRALAAATAGSIEAADAVDPDAVDATATDADDETAGESDEYRGERILARIRLGAARRERGEYDAAERALRTALSSVRAGDPETGAVDRVRECHALLELARLARAREDRTACRGYAAEGLELAERYGIGLYAGPLGDVLEWADD